MKDTIMHFPVVWGALNLLPFTELNNCTLNSEQQLHVPEERSMMLQEVNVKDWRVIWGF